MQVFDLPNGRFQRFPRRNGCVVEQRSRQARNANPPSNCNFVGCELTAMAPDRSRRARLARQRHVDRSPAISAHKPPERSRGPVAEYGIGFAGKDRREPASLLRDDLVPDGVDAAV
jgi:hypothetical protein